MKYKYLVTAALIFTMLCTGCQRKETTANVPDTNVSDIVQSEEALKGEIATNQDDTIDIGAYGPWRVVKDFLIGREDFFTNPSINT
jgi:hypothetical protein